MIPTTRFATAMLFGSWLAFGLAASACRGTGEPAATPPPQPPPKVTVTSPLATPPVAPAPSPTIVAPRAPSPPAQAGRPCRLEGANGRPTKSLKSRGLVLEYQWSRRGPDDSDRFGVRVAKTGRIEVLSSGEIDFIDDKLVTKKVPLAWRDHGRLSAAEQTKLAATIRSSGFFELPCAVNLERKASDGGGFSLAVALDDMEVEIGGDANHPVVQTIVDLLTDLTAAADERSHH